MPLAVGRWPPMSAASGPGEMVQGRDRTIGASVGAQVKRRREQRGLTASELARRADLSKGSLSRIESGKGNPTIGSLEAISFALRLPLSDLLTGDRGSEIVHLAGTAHDGGQVQRELLKRIPAGRTIEVWRLRMPPSTSLAGVPHAAGTIEHLVVASGALRAGPNDSLATIVAGDLLTFPGDGPHAYRTSEDPADVTVLLVAPAH